MLQGQFHGSCMVRFTLIDKCSKKRFTDDYFVPIKINSIKIDEFKPLSKDHGMVRYGIMCFIDFHQGVFHRHLLNLLQ